MKFLDSAEFDPLRNNGPEASTLLMGLSPRYHGVFWVYSPTDYSPMKVIAQNTGGWDHVSVSHQRRIPNWLEMEKVKRLFFRDEETAVQFHVPPSDHINIHDRVLHLWRPHDFQIPLPPRNMV